MDSVVDGINLGGCNITSVHVANHHHYQYTSSPKVYEKPIAASDLGDFSSGMKLTDNPADSSSSITSIRNHKTSRKDHVKKDTLPDLLKHKLRLEDVNEKLQDVVVDGLDQTVEEHTSAKRVSKFDTKSAIKLHENGFGHRSSNHLVEAGEFTSHLHRGSSKETIGPVNGQVELGSQSGTQFCPSPPYSFYSAAPYIEAKQSFSNTEVSECASTTVEKYGEVVDNSCDFVESQKLSAFRVSSSSNVSDESSSSSLSSAAMYKPHKANDKRWEAIQVVKSHYGTLEMKHFRSLRMLGRGDIGTVHLAELAGTRICFAMKVMNKTDLAGRKKLARSQTEKEILQSLDHPFLPTLYAHFETERSSCLVMEYCPGGDLHVLRQRQPGKFFTEHAARFYVAEVLLALEYLHMLGIIYRDLKPENVLVREDGHIMLSDFDLSLRCVVSPTLVKSANLYLESKNSGYCVQPACIEPSCMKQPACVQPTCFSPRVLRKDNKKNKKIRPRSDLYGNNNQVNNNYLPELLAEPTSARSMSFVGTHEYLAPEIVKGEGHGSAVDWWTFGIFLYELLFGRTPFKGGGNRATLFNVVGQPLRFPDSPTVSFAARDLIRGLLVKEPQHRLAYRRGATEIKQHPFFQNVNWALIRCASPPDVPKPVAAAEEAHLIQNVVQYGVPKVLDNTGVNANGSGNYLEMEFF